MLVKLLLLIVCLQCLVATAFHTTMKPRRVSAAITMGNNAKFGIFSPVVYAAKLILGESKLNKIRGKFISLHSQAITDWCVQYGAYHLRLKLIKKAKNNGDRLGFLV